MSIVLDPFANPDSTGVGGIDFLTMLAKMFPQNPQSGQTGGGSSGKGAVTGDGRGGQMPVGGQQAPASTLSPDAMAAAKGFPADRSNPLNFAMGQQPALGPKAQAAKDEADALEHQLRAEQLRAQLESHKSSQLEAKRNANPTNSRNQKPMVGPTRKSPTGAMLINGRAFRGDDASGAASWANANTPRPQQGPARPSFQQSYYAAHPQLAVQRGVPIDRPWDPNNLAIQQMLYGGS